MQGGTCAHARGSLFLNWFPKSVNPCNHCNDPSSLQRERRLTLRWAGLDIFILGWCEALHFEIRSMARWGCYSTYCIWELAVIEIDEL